MKLTIKPTKPQSKLRRTVYTIFLIGLWMYLFNFLALLIFSIGA